MSDLTKGIKMNVFGTLSKEKINCFNPCYGVRNDCQVGQWKVGDDKFLGNSIDIAIIAMRPYFGSLGKTKNTSWLQIFFVGLPSCKVLPTNTVCVTYLKTQSLTNLGQAAVKEMEEIDPSMGVFTASFAKKTSDLGNYYVVDFAYRPRTEEEIPQLQVIADFLATQPVFADNVPDTMIELTEGVTPEHAKELLLLTSA